MPHMILGLLLLFVCGAALADDDPARYRVDVEIRWSAQTAPVEFPDRPHLTRFVGATHHVRYGLFADGATASSGVVLVAENGRSTVLEAEVQEAMRRGRAGTFIDGPALDTVPGAVSFTVDVTRTHYLVSFVSMIAPSPDWFTGVSAIDLRTADSGGDHSGWVDTATVPLWAWDSGSDSGMTFTAPNADTQPRESIRLVATPHFLTADGLVALGVARFTRVE